MWQSMLMAQPPLSPISHSKVTWVVDDEEHVTQMKLPPNVVHAPDGKSLAMKLEPWPGGRWFRDLGDGDGHCWATVQSIKKPTLLKLSGPLFMSQPVANNLIYRLSEEGGETVIIGNLEEVSDVQ